MKIYKVYAESYTGKVIMGCAEAIKQNGRYKLSDRHAAFGYKLFVPEWDASETEQEAIDKFINEKKERVAQLNEEISKTWHQAVDASHLKESWQQVARTAPEK